VADAKDRKPRECALERAQAAFEKVEVARWDDLHNRLRDTVRHAGG